jgi:putative tryptophan/tyrosine transport system substrate-binding protein
MFQAVPDGQKEANDRYRSSPAVLRILPLWLHQMHFQDFAGSVVVHAVGGFAGLAGAIMLGPRLGRYSVDGKSIPLPGHNITFAALGVIMLSGLLTSAGDIHAGQDAEPPSVGVILLGGPGPAYDALRQSLGQIGYVEGETIVYEPRFAGGNLDAVPGLARELVDLDVNAIVAYGAVGARAAKEMTDTIPIVFAAVLDPVPLGFAESLERPGGNVTGITSFDPGQAKRQFEILSAVVPGLSRIALLSDGKIPKGADGWNPFDKAYDAAARDFGLEPVWVWMEGSDLEEAFATFASQETGALVVLEVPMTLFNLKAISDLAAEHSLPSMFPAGWPNDGLISYGTSILNATPRIPHYVDMILKGAHPGEIPIEIVDQRQMVINLKTAKALDFTLPPLLLQRADQLI